MAACWAEMIEAAVDKQGCFMCPFVLGSDGEYSQDAMYPARRRAPQRKSFCMCLTCGVATNYAVCGRYVGHDQTHAKNGSLALKHPTNRSHPSTDTRTWLSQTRASKNKEAHTLLTEPLGDSATLGDRATLAGV